MCTAPRVNAVVPFYSTKWVGHGFIEAKLGFLYSSPYIHVVSCKLNMLFDAE